MACVSKEYRNVLSMSWKDINFAQGSWYIFPIQKMENHCALVARILKGDGK